MEANDPKFTGGRTVATKRALFVDFAVVKFQPVFDMLRNDGVWSEACTDPVEFLEKVTIEHFDICIMNLLLGGLGPFEMIKNIRANSLNPDIKVIVISRQVQKLNIQNSIQAGANDFVAEPFEIENLYHRILYHLTPKKVIQPEGYQSSALDGTNGEYLSLLLEATEVLSRTPRHEMHSGFLQILQKVAKLIQSNRTSLIIVDTESNTGVVLASSDDPNFYDFPIALHKYPEIQHVLNSGNFVLVEDVSQNSLTQKINEKVKTILIGSLMVFPTHFNNELVGVLTIRRPQANDLPSMHVMRILQAIANTLASHSNVKALLRKLYKDFNPKEAV